MAALGEGRCISRADLNANGWVTVQGYASVRGVSREHAQNSLVRAWQDGRLERASIAGKGGAFAYRAKRAK